MSEQIFGAVTAEAEQAGETERGRFEASRGPYFGFNGTYCYVVTDRSLWRGRLKARQLVGGAPDIRQWSLHECSATANGTKVTLTTTDGDHDLAFLTEALAQKAVAALEQ